MQNVSLEKISTITKEKVDNNPQNKTNVPILKFGNETYADVPSRDIKSAADAVSYACELLQINEKTLEYEDLKNDITLKYNTMLGMAKSKGETLSQEVIQLRLKNYIKGWAFVKFEQQAVMDENPQDYKYSVPAGIDDSEAKELLKKHYDELSDNYIEYYDGDGNGSIDIIEMFAEELTEYYMSQGLKFTQAKIKALETAEKFNKMSFQEVEQSSDNSKEMELYKHLQIKFGTLEDKPTNQMTIQDIRTLDKEEVQAFLFTKAQFDGNGENTITPTESGAIEYDIMTGGNKTPNWLKAARNFLGLK